MKPQFVMLTNLAEDPAGAKCATPVMIQVRHIIMALTNVEDKRTQLFIGEEGSDEDFIVVQESPTEVYNKIQEVIHQPLIPAPYRG